jgi:hypothetical protein
MWIIDKIKNTIKDFFTKKSTTKVIKDDDNNKQVFSSIGTSIVDGIKVAMATLLSIFVPQACGDHTCTLQENFSDLTLFNEFVIAWNFISLGIFIYTSIIQNKREAYFISHLDESRDDPYNSFEKNLKPYPKIVSRVKNYNNKLHTWVITNLIFFSLNILFSCILIFYFFYDGFRSVSTMLANVLLVSSKLYGLLDTVNRCREANMLALSTIRQEAVSYNVVDDAYALPTDKRAKYTMSIKIDKNSIKKMRLERLRSASVA